LRLPEHSVAADCKQRDHEPRESSALPTPGRDPERDLREYVVSATVEAEKPVVESP
jgi:hypothetical protein